MLTISRRLLNVITFLFQQKKGEISKTVLNDYPPILLGHDADCLTEISIKVTRKKWQSRGRVFTAVTAQGEILHLPNYNLDDPSAIFGIKIQI